MKKIGVIHTTPATISSLTKLIRDLICDVEVINILDDSILKDMKEGGHTEAVEKRWTQYANILESLGATVILSACSTVGDIAEKANLEIKIPVYRIDEAMIETAIGMGTKISVLATLFSTLEPTVNLLKRKGKGNLDINVQFVEGAYDALMSGDEEKHNRLIKEAVTSAVRRSQVVILAQASMAGAIEGMSEPDKAKILTSPHLGIEKLKKDLEKK